MNSKLVSYIEESQLPKECIRPSAKDELASIFAAFEVVEFIGDSKAAAELDEILRSAGVDFARVDLTSRADLLAELDGVETGTNCVFIKGKKLTEAEVWELYE